MTKVWKMESRGKGTKLLAGRLGEIRGVWDSPDVPGPWNGERFKSCLSQWDSVANNVQEIREEKTSAMISCVGDWLEAVMEERWWVQLGYVKLRCLRHNWIDVKFWREYWRALLKLWGWTLLVIQMGLNYHIYFLLGYMYTISSHHVVGITEDIYWMYFKLE